MKKLMTVMAAAATALFAIGAVNGEKGGADIEGEAFVAGNPLNLDANDYGTENTADGDLFWSMAGASDDIGVTISNYVAEASEPNKIPIETRPDLFASAGNTKYLALDTSSPLVRNMVGKNTEGSKAVDIEGGIYLDTLVKFTAADDVFGDDQNAFSNGVDKIAISYVEREDDDTTPEVNEALTNFVIRAGYIGANELTVKNYEAKLDGNVEFDKDAWHRLTVRTVPGIDAAGHVGFVVYVDETALVYADAQETIGDSVKLVGVAATVDKSVFPSAVNTDGENADTITSASFSGTGAIDDVVFTKVTPNFILTGEAVVVPFVADAGVKAISVEVKGDVVTNIAVTAAGTYTATLEAQTTAFTVNVTVDEANGYTFGGITVGETAYDTNPASVTGYAGGNITITTVRNNFNLFDAEDVAISGTFQTLSAALAKPGVAKIQLAHDYDVAANEDANFAGYTIAGDIVLDLAGKTINGGSSNTRCLFATGNSGSLIVINSVDSDNGKIIYGGTAGVFDCNVGEITIGSNTVTDYGPVIDGPAIGLKGFIYSIYTGKFLASENTTSGNEFVCSTEDQEAGIDVVDSDSTVKLVNGYWVVTAGDTPQPTTYTVTVTPTANANYAAVIGETTVTFTENVATVDAGSTVVITATASSGYTYTGVEATGWTIAQDGATATYTISSIAAAATVAIPAPTEKQQGGYDSGDGEHTFVIDSETEDELEDNLPEGKTLASAVSETSSMTYAQAYALGLWDAEATTVANLDATISVGADGKVTVSLANEPTTGYSVTCKVYEKASLTADWPDEAKATYAYGSEVPFTPVSATAGFYKVEVVITNAPQQ